MYDFNTLYEPNTVEEALALKKVHPEALLLAGGSDILIKLREGKLAGCDLISIYMLDELRGVYIQDNGELIIRPLTSFTGITMHPLIKQHVPVLGDAVDQIGGPQIRNIGTIGGNICNGVTSADSATTLKAYDAILELSSADGVRNLPYAEFNLGPGKVDPETGRDPHRNTHPEGKLGSDLRTLHKICKEESDGYRHLGVFGECETHQGQETHRTTTNRIWSRSPHSDTCSHRREGCQWPCSGCTSTGHHHGERGGGCEATNQLEGFQGVPAPPGERACP